MEQNSFIVENMERKSTDVNYEQPIESNVSLTNGHRILTPEISNLITSLTELAFENGLKLGKEPGNDIGMDKSRKSGN